MRPPLSESQHAFQKADQFCPKPFSWGLFKRQPKKSPEEFAPSNIHHFKGVQIAILVGITSQLPAVCSGNVSQNCFEGSFHFGDRAFVMQQDIFPGGFLAVQQAIQIDSKDSRIFVKPVHFLRPPVKVHGKNGYTDGSPGGKDRGKEIANDSESVNGKLKYSDEDLSFLKWVHVAVVVSVVAVAVATIAKVVACGVLAAAFLVMACKALRLLEKPDEPKECSHGDNDHSSRDHEDDSKVQNRSKHLIGKQK